MYQVRNYFFLAGHGDRTISNVRAGCLNLLHTVQSRVKPKYHIFGHIHEGTNDSVHDCVGDK